MPAPKNIEELQAEVSALDPRYVLEKIIGSGSYGVVIRARDTADDNALVAIKRVNAEIFEETILAKRILREIKLLGHFHDDNIVGLRNILTPRSVDFDSFYIVMDIMETDLKQVLRSGQKLTDAHIQFFVYQALRALRVIHEAGVIHRDITPANILVNTNCDLKICDFGLAKEEGDQGEDMTDYVTMRWYRAPELVMEHRNYTNQIDVWGIGCILAELLGSRPICQGKDRVNQLDKIIDVTGKPSEEEISSLGSAAAQKYLRRKSPRAPMDVKEKYPNASPEALDLLQRMITFHPDKRITVIEAMKHPYLAQLFDEEDEKIKVPPFVFDENQHRTIADVKKAIYQESLMFHKANPKTAPQKGANLAVSVEDEGRAAATSLEKFAKDEGKYDDD
jgi:mitogen-activated protein kinase 1/3